MRPPPRPPRRPLVEDHHYQAAPTDLDPLLFGSYGSTQRNNAPTLPVIRVFGSTETGQKVCAHIHGALPYLYLEYRGSLEKHTVNNYILQLRASIDHALAVSYRRNLYDGNAVFVGHVTLVKGVPFFGYHVGYRYFLKVYLLNPMNMTRFADLLHQGAIMKQVMQPFEAHLQYLAQWMIDFNLYGCSYIECSQVRFRDPVPECSEVVSSQHKWHDRSIPSHLFLDTSLYPRQSHCSIEVDIAVCDIINRHEVEVRDIHADFVERFNNPAPDEKLVHSLAGLWRDETMRRKRRMGLTDPSSSPFPPEVLISMSADPRNTDGGAWIHEEEYRTLVADLIRGEASKDSEKLTFDNFSKRDPLDHTVQTTLESVEDLFPHRLKSHAIAYFTQAPPCERGEQYGATHAVVDETSISHFSDLDFPYESDEEAAQEIAMTQRPKAETVGTPMTLEVGATGRFNDGPAIGSKRTPQECKTSSPSRSKGVEDVVKNEHDAEPLGASEESDIQDLASIRKQITQAVTPVGSEGSDEYVLDHGSRKRRKLNVTTSLDTLPEKRQSGVDEQRPRSRHARFELDVSADQAGGLSNKRTRSPTLRSRDRSSGTPSNSQMSQASIDAGPGGNHGVHGFRITKPGSQQSLESKDVKNAPATGENVSRTIGTILPRLASTGSSVETTPPIRSQLLRLVNGLQRELPLDRNCKILCYGKLPPTATDFSSSLIAGRLPSMIYQNAFYTDERDVPERSRDYGGREFKLESITTPFLPDFDPTATSEASVGARPPIVVDHEKQGKDFQRQRYASNLRNWDFAALPPSRIEVERWASRQPFRKLQTDLELPEFSKSSARQSAVDARIHGDLSQIEGPTQKNRHGFKFSQKHKSTSVTHETQYMSTMSLEIHVNSRQQLAPDPEHDQVACIFWCLKSDDDEVATNGDLNGTRVGVLALAESPDFRQQLIRETKVDIETENNELDLLNRLVDIVREFDPDVLTGYEVHNGSWGYLIERARIKYEFDLCDEFSRMRSQSHGRFGKEADRWGFEHTSTVRVTGRHMINIWRAMRSEVNLLQYTMENVVFHLLQKRIPHYSFRDLSDWYDSKAPRDLAKCLEYYMSRVQLDLEILDANELIPRTSEQARLIGVDFFSVFSRGSQFKVESFMFRIAKPENFLLVSPSRKQVGQQNALECLPLVMEPQSDFYSSPLLVLDFQSLYPSLMIAYNYCYSTCLGRIVNWRGQNKMGFAEFRRQPHLLGLVKDSINIAPNGLMFVKPEMRKSLLAKMLGEILETRVMVKSGMKVDKDDKTLQQLLNNRQLALKLLANVTYGYTSASFSGRMPCSEIADSIVQTARETLEKAIALIHSVERWGAEVVYGDTDSLFIYLKGRTREEAFVIGNEMAKAVTDANPRPVKLKFEKVYHPCVLLAKKRYVGFKYESPEQKEPEFDAKGIETVRRDGTPAEQKIEEKALKLLFRTSDLSQVKAYFQRQCSKIMMGKVSIHDFCFAREVKLGTYSAKGPPPPGALISTRRMLADPRLEPQYGERVPYVVVSGGPKARLIDRCVAPETLLTDESAELDAEYYISKNVIPPLERIFNLVGANVRQWYDEMPKVLRIRDLQAGSVQVASEKSLKTTNALRRTLESYMKSSQCLVCRTKLDSANARPRSAGKDSSTLPLCSDCRSSAATSLYILRMRLRAAEVKARNIEVVCRDCSGLSWAEEVKCDSKDCPVFYSRVRARAKEMAGQRLLEGVGEYLEEVEEALDW